MEAVFPTGTLPVSAVVTTVLPSAQDRSPGSHRLVEHALSVVAAEMGLGLGRIPGGVASYNPVVIVGPAGWENPVSWRSGSCSTAIPARPGGLRW